LETFQSWPVGDGGVAYTLAFDYDGQLTGITTGGTVKSFGFNAIGRRVTRTAGGVTTRFYYDGDRDLVEKQGATTTGTYTYGEELIRKDSETLLYDGGGNLRCSTNASQAIVDTANPDAFGKTIGSSGSTNSPFQYGGTSGYQNWGDAGLYHVGARSYDPQVGRFISRDTDLSQNPYLYCDGDPVNCVDPSGHAFWKWFKVFLFGEKFGAGVAIGAGLADGVGAVQEIHHAYELRDKFRAMPKNTLAGGGYATDITHHDHYVARGRMPYWVRSRRQVEHRRRCRGSAISTVFRGLAARP
jgi:RHS repeat-associated protein